MPRFGSSSKVPAKEPALPHVERDLEELIPTSPAIPSPDDSEDESDESISRRQAQRGTWTHWNCLLKEGIPLSECAEMNRLQEPNTDQSGLVSFLSHQKWSYPATKPPPPPIQPSENWRRHSARDDLQMAREVLHEDERSTLQWINCGIAGDMVQEG